MRLKIIPVLVLTLLAGLACTAAAEEMTGSNGVFLRYVIAPAGSTNTMTGSNNIKLYDIKGQPVIGVMLRPDVLPVIGTTYLGAGYALWYEEEGPITFGVETGVPLTIERDGSDIRLSWDDQQYTNVTVFYMIGDGTGQFKLQRNNAVFPYQIAQGAAFTSGTGFIKHLNQVGTGSNPEIYYKAFESANPSNADFDAGWAVGKVNVPVERDANNIRFYSFSVPLIPQQGDTFSSVFPAATDFLGASPSGNLLEADQIRGWSGSSWQSFFKSSVDSNWYSTTNTSQLGSHLFCRGYVLRLRPASEGTANFDVTIVGKVIKDVYQSDTAYGGPDPLGNIALDKFTAFGDPAPKTAIFNTAFSQNVADLQSRSAGMNLLEADQVRYWDHAQNSWASCYFNGSDWLKTQDQTAAFPFGFKKGYVFRKADNRTKNDFVWQYLISY